MKTENVTQTSQFVVTITSNLCVPHITCSTRITTTSSTLIDNIYSNSLNFAEGISGNLTTTISHHLAQFLILLEENYKSNKKQNLFKRDTKDFDRENFILDLLDINWQNVISTERNDPIQSCDSIEITLNTLIGKYIPLQN